MTDTRIQLKDATPLLGLPERTVRAMAACGEIPGAARLRGRWTFNLEKLRRYIAFKEAEACQGASPRRAVSGAAARSGAASRLKVATSNGLYAQTIQKLQSAGTRSNGTGK